MEFAEKIRLIVWDLDETFWDGTLTEGGIGYRQDYHDLVIELAGRGIVSAICSKNDHDQIEALLREKGLWDYFIFPSIDWTPKGPRIEALLKTIGLRAPTVLFLDDNPMNLEQARQVNPGLNVADPEIIAGLRDHPQLQGKDDRDLTRLKQYKVMEEKTLAAEVLGGDVTQFLRKSNVRVYFEYDVEQHLDRAIELINRTNQLNFTKQRLPEDPDAARAELLKLLRHNTTDAALIRVVDDYGDYGFVGLYVTRRVHNHRELVHFCFSCRTLNMFIEHWVYAFLQQPRLKIEGEVLSNVLTDEIKVDWVTAGHISELGADKPTDKRQFARIFARGGCDLASLVHYFTMHSDNIIEEFNAAKNGQLLRRDHSAFLLPALEGGLTEAQLEAAQGLGYDADDFSTVFLDHETGDELYLLSFWADMGIPVYRHRASGLRVPYWGIGAQSHDLIARADLRERLSRNDVLRARLTYLAEDFDCEGMLTPKELQHRYRLILDQVPRGARCVLVLANERGPAYFKANSLLPKRHKLHVQLNKVLRAVAQDFPHVELLDPSPHISGAADLIDLNHFKRDVYHSMYQGLMMDMPT